MRLLRRVAWLMLLAAGLLACAAVQAAPRIGEAVALPPLSTVDGKAITPAQLRGKPVVIAWFATWCPYCAQEAPKLQKLYQDSHGRLAVIGVNIDRGDPQRAAKVRQWIAKYKLTHAVTLDDEALERVFGKRKGLPVVAVIDKHGVLRQVEVGEMLDDDIADLARYADGQ